MVAYGNNSDSQRIAFGAPNSSLDLKTETAREVATTAINAHLNREYDIDAPSDGINRICNLLAAAILTTKMGEAAESALWKMGIELLEKYRGDNSDDNPWRVNIPVERFRGLSSIDEIRPYNFVN